MVVREGDKVIFSERVSAADLIPSVVALYKIETAGYSQMVLDFTGCSSAFANPMLVVCARVIELRESRGIEVDVRLPSDQKLRRLFLNCNWANLLDPEEFEALEVSTAAQLPATRFSTADEQHAAVAGIVEALLGSAPDLARDDLAAFEWAVNEITDNVLVHADSPIGGLVQVSFLKSKNVFEYVVVDAGLGIPRTLRSSHPGLYDGPLLALSVEEGVTRDKSVGQGNGLFGSYKISSTSRGFFHLESGLGKLTFSPDRGLAVVNESVPFRGTFVAAQMNLSVPHLLEQALRFGGRSALRIDMVELRYEQDAPDGQVLFVIGKEARSTGSRLGGTPVRTKLRNLLHMCAPNRIVIDFRDVAMVSSSFADEVFGKLRVEIGQELFSQRFVFRNATTTIQRLIDKAIAQRIRSQESRDR